MQDFYLDFAHFDHDHAKEYAQSFHHLPGTSPIRFELLLTDLNLCTRNAFFTATSASQELFVRLAPTPGSLAAWSTEPILTGRASICQLVCSSSDQECPYTLLERENGLCYLGKTNQSLSQIPTGLTVYVNGKNPSSHSCTQPTFGGMLGMEPCHNVQVPSSSLSIFGSKTSHFELVHDKKTYPAAKADCESRNQRLAIIKTSEAYQFMVDIGN